MIVLVMKRVVKRLFILMDTFRDYDIIGRVGGEEFAVCMPNITIEDAFKACERSRKMLKSHIIDIEYEGKVQQLSLTVSIVGTCFQGQSISFDELLRAADYGLYRAKKKEGIKR
jgi:diguanylate cyclase (GGDEF)-like protein